MGTEKVSTVVGLAALLLLGPTACYSESEQASDCAAVTGGCAECVAVGACGWCDDHCVAGALGGPASGMCSSWAFLASQCPGGSRPPPVTPPPTGRTCGGSTCYGSDLCVNFTNVGTRCAPPCSAGYQCATNCCAQLREGGGACAPTYNRSDYVCN